MSNTNSPSRKLASALVAPWRISPRKSKRANVVSPLPGQQEQQQPDDDHEMIDNNDSSPTRVLDYDDAVAAADAAAAAEIQQQPGNGGSKSTSGTNKGDIFRSPAPSLALHQPGGGVGSSSRRTSRQYFSSLPTLDETISSDASECSFDDDDDDNNNDEDHHDNNKNNIVLVSTPSPNKSSSSSPQQRHSSQSPQKKKALFSLSPSRRKPSVSPVKSATATIPSNNTSSSDIKSKTSSSHGNNASPSAESSAVSSLQLRDSTAGTGKLPTRKSSTGSSPRTFSERMAELQTKAKDLVGCGEDQSALHVYKKALKLARHETGRVKKQLRGLKKPGTQAQHHPSALPSIASRLHEDWLSVGQSIADVRIQMAVLCERIGDYDRALTCCTEASGVYKRQLTFLEKNPSLRNVSVDVSKKADELKILLNKMHQSKDSFANRKLLHEDIILLRRTIVASDIEEEKMRLHAAMQEQTERALALETQILGPDHPQVADTLSLLTTIAYEKGDILKAKEYMRQAISIAEKSLGLKHPGTGEMMLQMARLYATQAPAVDREAIRYYEQAVEVFRASERNPGLVGVILNELSVIYIRQRQYEQAIIILGEALEAYKQEREQQQKDKRKDVAMMIAQTDTVQIFRNLGECYLHLKQFGKASDAFVHALDLQRDARKMYDAAASEDSLSENSPPPAYLVEDVSIADTLRRLGKSYMGSRKPSDALAVYGEALLIHRSAVVQSVNPNTGRPNEGLPERQDQLAHTLFCIAEAREAMGDPDEALRIYSESMQLRLFSDAHRQDTSKRQNMVHCAMCLRGIGNCHTRKQEHEAAQKVLEDALSYCVAHGVPSDHAIVVTIKQQLEDSERLIEQKLKMKEVQILKHKASMQIANGDLDPAVDTLTEMMTVRKSILKMLKSSKQDPSDEQIATAETLKLFGDVLVQKGDYVNAERAFGDALKLFKKAGFSSGTKQVEEQEKAVQEVKFLLKRLKRPN